MLYTQIGAPFQEWAQARINERNQEALHEDFINMDPEVAQAFRASTAVSRKYPLFIFPDPFLLPQWAGAPGSTS